MSDTYKDIDKVKKDHYTLNIFFLKSKIENIQQDIIRLKSENRAIGDKVNSYQINIKSNEKISCKVFFATGDDLHSIDFRIYRDKKTVEYLKKLQQINGKLIRKHRAKIKELRTELSVYELLSKDV